MDKMPTKVEHSYKVEYRDASGELVWQDEYENLVPDAWLNQILTLGYKGATGPANFYIGLVDGGSTPTYAAGDLYNSHAGWSENSASYSNATRVGCTWGSVSAKSVSNSASAAVFNITGTATIAGCFLATVSTKGDSTSGASNFLCGCGNFSSGNKSVSSGGTLTVTVTATAA